MTGPTAPEITDATRDALRLAGDRTRNQVRESGQFNYQKKRPGDNPEREFFDIFVYLLGEKGKADKALSIVSNKNFKIEPDTAQLSYDDLSRLKSQAHEFIKFSKLIEEDDNPIPEEYRHIARINDKGQVSLEFQAIGDHLLSMFNIVTYVGKQEEGVDGDILKGTPDIYVYDDKTGIYSKDTAVLKSEITRLSEAVQYKGSIVNATREIFFYIAFTDPQKEYPFNEGKNLIPVLNGVLRLNFEGGNHTLIPHSPENRFTYLVPVRYDPAADPEHIDKILRQYVSEDQLPLLYQIPAQTILQGFCDCSTFRKAYLIQGPSRGGKSTYSDMLVQWFFSPRFVANVTLQDLCGDSRFATYDLPGKFLNLYDDLDDMGTLRRISDFKNLIGSYNQSVEKKGSQRRNEKISCVHAFTCNRPPLLENTRIKTDRAWWERWNIVRFNDSEFEVDPTFQERNFTSENLSGFLNKVLEYVVTIMNDKTRFISQDYEEVISFWDTSSDPLSSFISECFYPTPGKVTKYNKDLMLASYHEYCAAMGIDDIHGINTVEKLSRKLFDTGFTPGRSKDRGYLYQANMAWQGIPGISNPTHKEDTSQGRLIQ